MTIVLIASLITVVIGSAILLFILLASPYRQSNIKRLLSGFNDAVSEFNLSVSKQDLFGNSIIGLDEKNNKVIFFTNNQNKHEGHFIDLAGIKNIDMKEEYGDSFDNYSRDHGLTCKLHKVSLQINYKNGAKPFTFSFYDHVTDSLFEKSDRTALAKEWKNLLSSKLSRRVQMKATMLTPTSRTYLDAA